jgi:hypothetical protein
LPQLTGNWSEAKALSNYKQLQKRFSSVLGDRAPMIIKSRMLGHGSAPWYLIRVAESTRDRAKQLCSPAGIGRRKLPSVSKLAECVAAVACGASGTALVSYGLLKSIWARSAEFRQHNYKLFKRLSISQGSRGHLTLFGFGGVSSVLKLRFQDSNRAEVTRSRTAPEQQ